MEIELWGIDFNKRKNSTKIPQTTGVKKQVTLKNGCSVISPSFFVTGVVGYSYLKAWNNYYWITNIAYDINGAEYIDCRIDVLASWRSVITGSTFFVERCADSRYYNTDLFDEALSIEDGLEVSSSADTNIFGEASGSYLVTILGKSANTGIATFVFSAAPPAGLFNPLYSMDNIGDDGFIDGWSDILEGFQGLIKLWISDPSKFIVSVKFSPLTASWYLGGSAPIYVGWFDTGISAQQIGVGVWKDTFTLNKPTSIYNDFRRTDSRCSVYNIYFPGVGTVDLAPEIIEFTLSVEVALDMQAGGVHYTLMADGAPVGTYDGNIYSDVGYGGSSINGGAITQTAGGIAGAMSAAPHIATDVVDIETTSASLEFSSAAQKVAFIASVVTAIKGIGGAIKPQASLASPIGSRAATVANPDITVSCIQKHTAEFPVNDFGRPCCKNLTLGSLTGFVKCANASIDISANLGIREEINTFLNTGFFME